MTAELFAQRGAILPPEDTEANRFAARAARYVRVGANVGGVAAKIAATRLFGLDHGSVRGAADLAAALGGLKGPIMKVAQLMATVPDLLPSDYAAELTKLQSDAPPMGWAFVKRRMTAELGADWSRQFEAFEHKPAAAASMQSCFPCHSQVKARDLVFTHYAP